jgi:hypothetical protein
LSYKERLVAKEGKGRYDLTIPTPYEFQKNEGAKKKTIREKKVEEMIKSKLREEDKYKDFKFSANAVPRTTTQPLYQKITDDNQMRRMEVRRMSLALTKQNEKPFSFYTRDKD